MAVKPVGELTTAVCGETYRFRITDDEPGFLADLDMSKYSLEILADCGGIVSESKINRISTYEFDAVLPSSATIIGMGSQVPGTLMVEVYIGHEDYGDIMGVFSVPLVAESE